MGEMLDFSLRNGGAMLDIGLIFKFLAEIHIQRAIEWSLLTLCK